MPRLTFAFPQTPQHATQTRRCPTLDSPRSPLLVTSFQEGTCWHPRFSPSAKGADLVLASSDRVLFAVNRDKLFCHSDAFRSVGLETFAPNSKLPLVQLSETKEVIEVMLGCLHPNELPDFSKLDFNILVAVLEAAADKYRLVHTEKICLLALGAWFKSRPVEVFVLARAYDCGWLAQAASEYTLDYDLESPEFVEILTPESFQCLNELRQHRVNEIRNIVISNPNIRSHTYQPIITTSSSTTSLPTTIKTSNSSCSIKSSHSTRSSSSSSVVTSKTTCDGSEALRFWRPCAGRLLAQASPSIDLVEIISEEQINSISKMSCRGCMTQLLLIGERTRVQFLKVRKTVL